jgi:hypothetical protein
MAKKMSRKDSDPKLFTSRIQICNAGLRIRGYGSKKILRIRNTGFWRDVWIEWQNRSAVWGTNE